MRKARVCQTLCDLDKYQASTMKRGIVGGFVSEKVLDYGDNTKGRMERTFQEKTRAYREKLMSEFSI